MTTTPHKDKKQFSLSISAQPVDASDRFGKMARFYHREAELCAKKRAYFAACVLAGAALEALLLSMCYIYDRKVRSTLAYQQKRFKSKRNRFLEFNLFQLINIAAELKWIPSKEIRIGRHKTTLQELMHWVRDTRNLVHPAVWAKEGGPRRIYKNTYSSAFDVLDITRRWLLQEVLLGLRQQMHREGILIRDDLWR